ncbi:MAG: hypothetical protein E7051_07020 [Lentisphaerae bacterium]|nr:hypothetical protein [Lentisphaerota bacterium]MBQ4329809.1 hypothetical protein [Lentisphaeria bacterium]
MRNYKELILVGGVFTLLAVLMSAALDTADAKNAFCQNNLKVLYVSVTEYQAAHNALPPVIVEQKPRWAFWSGYIKPFVKDLKNMACPEDARNAHMLVNVNNPLMPKPQLRADSYGMNYFLTRHFAAKKKKTPLLKNLSNPKKTVVFGDCKGPYMLPERYWKEERAMRHEKESANYVFADGSVKNLTQMDFGSIGGDGKFKTDMTSWHWL